MWQLSYIRRSNLILLGVGIILGIISCKNIQRPSGIQEGINSSTSGVVISQDDSGIQTQGVELVSDTSFTRTDLRQQGIKEPEGLSSQVVARNITLTSEVFGCSSVEVPPRVSSDPVYTYAPSSKINPIIVDTACFPYELKVSYKCKDSSICYEGSSRVSIEDFVDVPEGLKVPVKVNPSREESLNIQEIAVDLVLTESVVKVIDFFNDECLDLEYALGTSPNKGYRLKVLPDCYDSFYKSYSVDGFEYDMFDKNSEEVTVRCDRSFKNLQNLGSLDNGDKLVIIKSLQIDDESYQGKQLNFSELLLSVKVNTKFSVGYERAENIEGTLHCFRGNKSWKKIN